MRLGIMGTKKWLRQDYVEAIINDYLPNIQGLVTAYESGACTFALDFTKEFNETLQSQDLDGRVTTVAFELDLDYPRDEALVKRNQNIINMSDLIICFWDNADEDVRIFINQAITANKHLIIHCVPIK